MRDFSHSQNPGEETGEATNLPLDYSHNPLLVIVSFAIALMAGFAGLSATRGASECPPGARKRLVAVSAILLGGGIWSMHFVAMLGLQLPVPFFYDALITLISALTGILVVGLGLIVLHFRERSAGTITLSGLILGGGILAMHYIGMAGMEACRATYTASGIAISAIISLALGTLAVWVAYGERTRRNILIGTLCFAVAVVSLHFVAIANTSFFETPLSDTPRIRIGNETLAFIVTLAAFTICGGFLLTGATFFPDGPDGAAAGNPAAKAPAAAPDATPVRSVPYEKNGRTLFAEIGAIAALRAEGHYTLLYLADERVFCTWSISEAETRLAGTPFIRVHRSYLINPAHVSGFERRKDSGVVYFDAVKSLDKVPVSRSRLQEVRETLGL